MSIYKKIGVKRVINALGTATILGGSTIPTDAFDAMIEANKCYVEMWQLHEQAGKIVAQTTGAEAGWVTPGCYAALVLSVAACIAGKDADNIRKLPDTRGMKNQVIIQHRHRYFFDDAVKVAGGRLVVVGDASGCSQESMEAAINGKTAGILYFADVTRPTSFPEIPLNEVIEIGKLHNVPVIVDAAAQIPPWVPFTRYTAMGADLVCYGGKYFGGPHSTGFVVGKKGLIDSVALQSYIGHHSKNTGSLGRGYKIDRQEIIAMIVALQNWINLDHKKHFEDLHRKADYLKSGLGGIPGVKIEDMTDRILFVGFRITLENKTWEETEELDEKALKGGTPSVWLNRDQNSLIVNVWCLYDNEEKLLCNRLKQVLTGKS